MPCSGGTRRPVSRRHSAPSGGTVSDRQSQGRPIVEALESQRVAAARLVDDLRTELAGIFAAQEADPPDDEHDVEGASVGFERARITALLTHAERALAAIDEAARRVVAGEAAQICEVCGGPIDPERLLAVPTTRRCVRCAAPTAQQRLGATRLSEQVTNRNLGP